MKIATIPADATMPIMTQEVDKIDLFLLQREVGGYIEALGLPDQDMNLYMHEEGKILGLPINLRATMLWNYYGARIVIPGELVDTLVGPVVVVGAVDDEGEDTGLSDEQVAWLEEHCHA